MTHLLFRLATRPEFDLTTLIVVTGGPPPDDTYLKLPKQEDVTKYRRYLELLAISHTKVMSKLADNDPLPFTNQMIRHNNLYSAYARILTVAYFRLPYVAELIEKECTLEKSIVDKLSDFNFNFETNQSYVAASSSSRSQTTDPIATASTAAAASPPKSNSPPPIASSGPSAATQLTAAIAEIEKKVQPSSRLTPPSSLGMSGLRPVASALGAASATTTNQCPSTDSRNGSAPDDEELPEEEDGEYDGDEEDLAHSPPEDPTKPVVQETISVSGSASVYDQVLGMSKSYTIASTTRTAAPARPSPLFLDDEMVGNTNGTPSAPITTTTVTVSAKYSSAPEPGSPKIPISISATTSLPRSTPSPQPLHSRSASFSGSIGTRSSSPTSNRRLSPPPLQLRPIGFKNSLVSASILKELHRVAHYPRELCLCPSLASWPKLHIVRNFKPNFENF